ncbi:AP complex subunit beta [Paramicrosporidium saccamoebae]|uniref:AP complex subunit beta n=1 Tax=Paramicrosporidium saccamoebae TaxID=1246581 RepID=A0A2H9TM53_9FUNG|nr:AP complex subunit beta [Paramicrosporidium saccamoebae]
MAAERLRQFASAAAAAAVSITRPNYFDTSKRGNSEAYDFEIQLVRKEAVKKVIASMTIGKDVGSLFPDVLKNIQTDDIELKKLDADDPNPLVRALALRTMGCLRVDKVLDYLCEPLRKALQDENAYVRKTAAVCAAKVVELSPELAEENGFVDMLKEMLADNNASVLANVVAALSDIHEKNPQLGAFHVDARTAARLVAVLNDCTEWGQISVLDTLVTFQPETVEETIQYLEKITPRLQHVNSSVVLSAVKVILVYMTYLPEDHEIIDSLKKKLAPPLVSMLSSPPEVQYIVLRNINLILQRRRDILAQGVRVFFCKFNDPLYVKLEKLLIITELIDEDNFEQVLSELSEYAKEVDGEFAKRSIECISDCALKVPVAAPRAFSVLEQLLASQGDYVFQAIAIALHSMLRRFPDAGLDLVTVLLANLDVYDEDEARAAIVWILGQYGPMLDNTVELLSGFIDNFALEPTLVQSELLTTCLKLFIADHTVYRESLQSVISKGLAGIENANLRERSIMYGRVLDADPSFLSTIQAGSLGLNMPGPSPLDPETVDRLLSEIGTVASVYHRLSTKDTITGRPLAHKKPLPLPDLLNLDEETEISPSSSMAAVSSSPQIVDLLAD